MSSLGIRLFMFAPLLFACSESAPPRTAASGGEVWTVEQSDPVLEAGRTVWVENCVKCHSTGLADAPVIGNRKAWQPRVAQGLSVLIEHARDGFVGELGSEMPARGGNAELSDGEIASAVRYMVQLSR